MRISKFNPPYYMYMELVSSVLQVRKSHKVTGLHKATKAPRKAKEKTIPHFEPYLHCDFHCQLRVDNLVRKEKIKEEKAKVDKETRLVQKDFII